VSEPTEVNARQASPLASPDPWNLVAEGYDRFTRGFLEAFSRSGLAMLRYGGETRAIDIACGPGTTSMLLAPAVRHVTCVDFSAPMLKELRRNLAAIGATNIEIVEGDGQALPFQDASFDLGVSMFGLMFFPDRDRGFAELNRVLAPGGQALVSSWAPIEQSPLMQTVFAALQPDDAPMPTPAPSGLEDPAIFEAEMREAGFADIRIEAIMHAQSVDDAKEFWQGVVRGAAPVTMLKHNSSDADWARIEARALQRIRRALPELPATLSSTAYLAVGRKA